MNMTEFVEYLRVVKTRLVMKSDRELAHKIGITGPAFSSIMAGISIPSEEHCVKIAQLAGDDPAYVIALARRCKAPESSRPYWDRILKVLATASMVGMLIAPYFFSLIRSQDILCKIIFTKILIAAGLCLSAMKAQGPDKDVKPFIWRALCSRLKKSHLLACNWTVLLKSLMI